MKKVVHIIRLKAFLFSLLILWIGTPAKAQNPHWIPNVNPFDDYMIIIAYITIDELELKSDQWEVGCFIGEECRGDIQLTEANYMEHSYLAFLSVWGSSSDNGKPITFRLYGRQSDKEYEIIQSIVYEHEGVVGGDDVGPCHSSVIINDVVAAAKAVLENTLFTITWKEGNTEAEVKTWLVNQINRLLTGSGISVSADDITISNFVAAIASTEDNPVGIDGSFVFTVSLTKGGSTEITNPLNGIITATLYEVKLEKVSSAALRASTTGNGLLVMGLIPGNTLCIYNAWGQLLIREQVKYTEQLMTLPEYGIYIITAGSQRVKVLYH